MSEPTGRNGKIENYTFANLREAISNCIAHQDYRANAKILVCEFLNKIVFKNAGKPFITEQQYNDLLKPTRDFAPIVYRNLWLYEAMDSIGLVEGSGSGFRNIVLIKRFYQLQVLILT